MDCHGKVAPSQVPISEFLPKVSQNMGIPTLQIQQRKYQRIKISRTKMVEGPPLILGTTLYPKILWKRMEIIQLQKNDEYYGKNL